MTRSASLPSPGVASEPERTRPDSASRWARAVDLVDRIESLEPGHTPSAAYRFGEVVVDLFTRDASIGRSFAQLYAECGVHPASAPARLRLRCFARPVPESGLTSATFDLSADVDLVEVALAVLQVRQNAYYVARELADTGWRVVTAVADPAVPLLAVSGRRAMFDPARLAPTFLRDFLVGTALTSQKEILFLHAASVAVRGRGVLLVGRGGTGKTTLALALAARGHGLLGDDYASLHTGDLTLLPFRRNLHIRPGPRAPGVEDALQGGRYELEAFSDGHGRLNATVRDLFPAVPAPRVPLAAAFFLCGFSLAPHLTPLEPSLERLELLKPMASSGPIRASWGISPGRRLLGFLRVIDILSKVHCYLLDVGRPDETAAHVERVLEDV